MTLTDKIEAAAYKLGKKDRIEKFIEESTELQLALIHGKSGKSTDNEIRTEIVDTFLTLSQIICLYFDDMSDFDDIFEKVGRKFLKTIEEKE